MKKEKVSPFGIKDKAGYLFGDLGNDFTFLLSSGFLMKFYTDVMGVEAALVGTVMMVARFVDAFSDITMGRICDKSPVTERGKFRPWILRMSLPVTISSFLMYQSSFSVLSPLLKGVYLFVTYILWGSIFYTSVNIPYGSMASAISAESGDRQSLSVYRTLGGMIAGTIINVIIPLSVYDEDGGRQVINPSRFTVVAGIFSCLAFICYLLCYFLVRERVKAFSRRKKEKDTLISMLKNALGNKALLSITAASVFMLLSQLTMQQMSNYIFPNYYGNASMQSVSTITMSLGSLLAAAVIKPLSVRFGKAEISVLAGALASGVCLLIYFIRPSDVVFYVLLQSLCWFALAIFSMVSWALITDVIDYSEIKNGIREDGSVYALYSFARKLGQAAAAGVSGALLTAIGYSEKTAFDKDVLEGIFDIAALVPALGFAMLAVVLKFFYPLKKDVVEKNIAMLREKHGRE